MRSKLAWLAALVAGAGMALLYRQQVEQSATLRREVEELRQEQERSRRVLQSVAVGQGLARAVVAPPGWDKAASAEAVSRPKPGSDQAAPQEPEGGSPVPGREAAAGKLSSSERWAREAEAHNEAIEIEFSTQPSGSAWASATHADLLTKVTDALPSASSVRSVECRSSLCRLELVFPSEEDSQSLFAKMFTDQEHFWNGSAAVTSSRANADGSLTKVLIVAREGAPLVGASPPG